MRISDWSSDVCSSDLPCAAAHSSLDSRQAAAPSVSGVELPAVRVLRPEALSKAGLSVASFSIEVSARRMLSRATPRKLTTRSSKKPRRSEEHTSELQSLLRNSYAVFCLKKK